MEKQSSNPKNVEFHTDTNPSKDRVGNVNILSKGEYLGEGKFSSSVNKVEATVVNDSGNESSPHTFVLKNYRFPQSSGPSGKKPGENALDNFSLLKNKGFKTWSTFRLSEDKSSAIMTNGNSKGVSLLATNITLNTNTCETALILEKKPLKTIKNFDSFLIDLFAEALKAEKEKIYINLDSYGFLVEDSSVKDGITRLDFVLCDLDNVEIDELSPRYDLDVQMAYDALKIFLMTYVDADPAYDYIMAAQLYIDQNLPGKLYKR